MGLAAGYECDEHLAKILPSGFCVSGHGVRLDRLLERDECRFVIIVFPTTSEAINILEKALEHGRVIKTNRTYYMDLDISACRDNADIVINEASAIIEWERFRYGVLAVDYNGKLLMFVDADITHDCRCVKINASEILKMIKETYDAWSRKINVEYVDLASINEILKYVNSIRLLPVIDAVCKNGINIKTTGRMITAEKNLNFKITKYACYDEEYPLDRELEFKADIAVKYEYGENKMRLLEVLSKKRKPIIIDDRESCHENINESSGNICLGTYDNKILEVSLADFNNDLCRALEYVFNVIQSALEKPNICSDYQPCYARKYHERVNG